MPQERNRSQRSEPSRQGGSHASSSPSSPPRRRRRSAGLTAGLALLYVVGVISVSILLACLGWMAANDVLALNKEAKEVTFTVSADESFDEITDRLKEEGLIEYKFLFKLFASFTNGEDKVTMGTYTLHTDMDYRALLAGMSMSSATKAEVSVTIPEGYTLDQVFQLLEEKGVATVEELEEQAAGYNYKFDFLQVIPLGDVTRLEGYLYPDTYTFYTPHSPIYAINKLLVNFDARVDEETRTKAEETGYTLREILTIASLIEKETDGTDRARIASVIYNRLNNPEAFTMGYLQIDATLAYINGGNVPTEADKAIDSPYNTYLYPGLPPAPIANPGLESIRAALEPEDTNYFYYALGDDDLHHFFRNYNDFQSFLASQERYQ